MIPSYVLAQVPAATTAPAFGNVTVEFFLGAFLVKGETRHGPRTFVLNNPGDAHALASKLKRRK